MPEMMFLNTLLYNRNTKKQKMALYGRINDIEKWR